jgi:mannose-6-phosphate isomerase-like protein (cupin superfamily)
METIMSEKQVSVTELLDNNEYQSLLKPPKSCAMRSGRVFLKKGEQCGRHSTEDHEETLVFLQGSGKAVITTENGEKEYDVGQGKVAYIPPHTHHNIKNTQDKPLAYIFCVAPVPKN